MAEKKTIFLNCQDNFKTYATITLTKTVEKNNLELKSYSKTIFLTRVYLDL